MKVRQDNRQLEKSGVGRTARLENIDQEQAPALSKHDGAEGVLSESEARFQILFAASQDAIFVVDLEGNVLDLNPSACRSNKAERDHLIGKQILELVPRNKIAGIKHAISELAAGRLDNVGFRNTEGEDAVFNEIGASKISCSGQPAFLLHLQDTSERKKTDEELSTLNQQLLASELQLSASNNQLLASLEQLKANEIKLREREERIRLIVDTAHDAVITMDESGAITAWNRQAEQILGWNRDEAIGQRLAEILLPPSSREAHDRALNHFLVTGESEWLNKRLELKAIRRDGSEFPVELTMSPLNIGGVYTFSAFVRDITERKQAEADLKGAKEAAEAANRSKSEFLANMSHEIRTPLNAIIGMTELVLDTSLSREQSECLKIVQSSSESLLSLINDILDFSKIEAGQMELEKLSFNLIELVEEVVDIVKVRTDGNNIELLSYVDPELNEVVIGDKTRLRQILVNLVGNAVKFTHSGEVSVRVEHPNRSGKAKTSGKADLNFKICDTGIGISDEQLAKIFEKFSQADNSTTRKFGGTGLGLSISRSLVKMMGGEIWVESIPGKGSTFQFNLSLSVGEELDNVEMDYGYPDFKDSSVLVVDDNDTNRFILRKTLNAWGLNVKEAENGPQAISFIRDYGDQVDLIILDYHMPGMDGLEVAQAIRKEPANDETRLVILTSWGELSAQVQEELNIAQTITKPIKQSKLRATLNHVLLANNEVKPKVVRQTPQYRTELARGFHRILLVEDNPDNQNLAKKILEKAGYRVDVACNGQLAVEAARESAYDLVLMDIQMPVMDGFEATKEIRAIEKSQGSFRVPIVALTAHALAGYRAECLSRDMDDFITKPLKKKVLVDTVEQWVNNRPVILVTKGQEDTVNEINDYLKAEGSFKAIFASNQDETVDLFDKHNVSLVLMDLEPSSTTAIDPKTAIESLGCGKKVPIIGLTSGSNSEADACLEAGCTELIAKPLARQNLEEMIDRFLGTPTAVPYHNH